MFDYKISKHPHFDEACRAFALRHNMAKLAERAEMNVQTLRNKLNPEQPHQLTAPEIWLLTDLTEDSTLVDGFLAQIHCLPCVPINEVAKEKLPHYVMSATAEIGRVAAGAVYGFAGMYDSGGYIPRGQFGIVGENGPEIVNGPANVTSRRNTAALAAVVAGMMGVAAAPAELPPLHPLALPAKGGEAIVSRAATVPLVQRIEAPTQIIIQTQPGQSAQDIAREVARQLDERERRLKAKARSNYSDQGGYDA